MATPMDRTITFTTSEAAIIEEIIGGRYDTLVQMIKDYPEMSDTKALNKDIETLRPIVEKLRNGQ